MAFIINKGRGDARTVDATHFTEKESFVIFTRPKSAQTNQQVLAIPTSHIASIELDES